MNELSNETMVEWLQDLTSKVRTGDYQVEFVPLPIYEWLDKAGRILATPAEKKTYLMFAADRRLGQLAEEVEHDNSETKRRQLEEFAAMRRAGEFTGDYVRQLKDLAKKMVLYEMLQDPGHREGKRKQEMKDRLLKMTADS